MARARLAHADAPIRRVALGDPAERYAIRERLYRMITRLGTVDPSSIRYARDPLDGPLAEQGLPNDEFAIVRISAMVAPHD